MHFLIIYMYIIVFLFCPSMTYFVTNSFYMASKAWQEGKSNSCFPYGPAAYKSNLFRNHVLLPISFFFRTITAPVRYNVHHHCHSSVPALLFITDNILASLVQLAFLFTDDKLSC